MSEPLACTWCEIDDTALRDNIGQLRQILTPDTILGIVVKGDAYGHGLVQSASAFAAAGAQWLVVHSTYEAVRLRAGGVHIPILICGPVQALDADQIVSTGARVVAYDGDIVVALAAAARRAGAVVPLHLKVETGTSRQGLQPRDVAAFVEYTQSLKGVRVEGACTHLADVEDGEHHDFARQQLAVLEQTRQALQKAGVTIDMWHAASSAAAIVLPESHAALVRIGIAAYGLWPSADIEHLGGASHPGLQLRPAMTWRARVAQVKPMPAGESVGYGRTWRSASARRLAILPVGYYEGFPRARSNQGHVLLRGLPAPVRGRICMNLTMVDVTDIEVATGTPIRAGEIATLVGTDGDAVISAEQFAHWAGTIHYEIVARISACVPRLRRPVDNDERDAT